MAKKKFYVVWDGVTPGIYTSWDQCKLNTQGYIGAKYKSFDSREEAEKAYASPYFSYINKKKESAPKLQPGSFPAEVIRESIAVDAACSGNPGPMEYRGVYLRTNEEIFHFGPYYGTNNIGEFLAIVHCLALLKNKGASLPIYSDSIQAIRWVKKKKCNTKLERDSETEYLFTIIERAEKWLQNNSYTVPVLKWDTARWGEIPADFGRK
ncbi:MAG: ribonuclease H family protein [Bacteroides sp.]|nr:ribonuclease H family protein [Bacteroides sp.]